MNETDFKSAGGLPRIHAAPRLTDRVGDVLLEMIFERGLQPGDPLPSQRELAEQLGVSRNVVREAVQSLIAKGIVAIRSGKGITVSAVDEERLSESISLFIRSRPLMDYPKVHEVRTLLELHVAAVAAERAEDDDLIELRVACEAMAEPGLGVDEEARRDLQFHRTLARLTHNEIYLVLLDSLGMILLDIRRATLLAPGRLDATLEEHRRIVDAIQNRDPDAARAAMSVHLQMVERQWRGSTSTPNDNTSKGE